MNQSFLGVPAHGPVGDGSILAVNRAIMQGVQTRAPVESADALR